MIHIVHMLRKRFPGRPVAPFLAAVAALGLAVGLSMLVLQ